MDGSSRTFRVNFGGDGLAKLRNRVTEKLKEFMGDYTDDTLVEYVIVLLRNGRQKEEAMKELNVFLGDDSVSFVTWLWDHLTFNLHLYVPQRESSVDDQTKYSVKQSSELEHGSGDMQSDPDYDQESSAKSKVRHNREWKGLVHEKPEPFLLRSTLIDDIRSAEKPVHRHSPVRPIRHSPSLRPQIHKKRSRQDEEPAPKREIASRPMLDAPRRLLQFAVRDAVRTVQKTSSKPGPVLKRLRSVVSTSTVDDLPHDDELPNRTRYLAVAPRAVATAIKAAAEAAEDVVKGRSSGNVFDRLSHGSVRPQINNQSTNFEAHVVEDENDEDFYQRSKHVEYRERDEYNGSGRDMPIVERSIEMACDSGSENDAYEDLSTLSNRVDASQSASYVPKMKDLPLMQHSNSQNANDTGKNTTVNDEDSSVATASNVSQKIVDISVNVNTCKPQNYQVAGEIATVGNHMAVQKTGENITMLDARLSNDNNATSGTNENGSPRQADAQKDVQKAVPSIHGSYSSGRPSDDADSRTIFVSNVHFAATKDTLSRHFNKFGEVLKVIIVTDAATGQPKGSAYVEFLRKESAELALSLNNTSFMSRLLKVVRRSAAHHEPSAMASWPRGISRASAFAPRLGRMSYPRGIMGGTFRARLPVKHGARSLQWKRDSPSTPANDGSKASQSYVTPGNTANSSTGKNLTYVRPDPKADSSVSLS